MRTILVTGGAGFVGSHACKALARAGYSPVTLDNLERGHDRAVKWGPLERGDLRDENVPCRVFETWTPWGVMHFAAYAYVGESRPPQILRQQCRRNSEPAQGLRSLRLQELCLFQFMCHVRNSYSATSD